MKSLPSAKSPRMSAWLMAGLLALVMLAVYWPATRCDFINFDDAQYVTNNSRIQQGVTWDNIQWYFTHAYFSNWHPVTSLSYLLDYQLWGLNPFGFHLTNILFHALNTALVFLVLWGMGSGVWRPGGGSPLIRPAGTFSPEGAKAAQGGSAGIPVGGLTGLSSSVKAVEGDTNSGLESPVNRQAGKPALHGGFWACALVAALFGLHPLHVESVAWVAERKDVLSGFFFLLTLWAYVAYARRDGEEDGGWRMEDGGTHTSPRPSPHLAPLPLPNAEREKRSLRHDTGKRRVIRGDNEIRNPQSSILIGRQAYYWLALGCFALGLMCKPMLVTLPCVLLLIDFWPLGRMRKGEDTSPRPSPQSGEGANQPLGRFTIYDLRFTILKPLLIEKIPFFGLAAASSVVTYLAQQQSGAVIAAQDYPLGDRLGNAVISYCRYLGKTFWPADLAVLYPHPGQWPMEQVLLAAAVLAGISWWCWAQRSRRPYLGVGWLWFLGTLVPVIGLVQAGKQAMADRYAYLPLLGVFIAVVWGGFELAGSLRRRKAILTITGVMVIALCGMVTWRQLDHWKNSETIYRHTLAVTTDNAVIHYNLGTTLCDQGKVAEAIEQFQETIRIKPNYAGARNNLAVALVQQDRIGEAIVQYQEALRLMPEDANTHYNLGVAFYSEGRFKEAIGQFQESLRLNPDDADARGRLAIATDLSQKMELWANDPGALNNAAWELATSPITAVRNGHLAIKLAERACELTQHRVTVMLGTLAAAYAEAGRFDDAVATAEKACALAKEQGEAELLKRNQELRELYQKHQPYREKP